VRIVRLKHDQLAAAAAVHLAERLRDAVAERGRATLAVSGGSTPAAMFAALADLPDGDVPWAHVHLYQVDERVAPFGHRDRNLTDLVTHLLSRGRLRGDAVHAMPVGSREPLAAAARYARDLPDAFDVIHLGIGDDGHTASLVPGDPVRSVTDRPVAFTQPYQGRVRLTLTHPVLDAARHVLWLVAGESKAAAVAGLLAGDPALPASHVHAADAVLFADEAALALAPGGP
jgi:6-phosphogluconolactonase